MGKHVLFLLKPGFKANDDGPFYCPDCATVEGFLRYAPEVEDRIDIRRIDFPRPRAEIVELLGEANQGCPALILDKSGALPLGARRSGETGRAFLSDPREICDFLGRTFGVVRPVP